MNAEFHCSVLSSLREDIRRKRPSLWRGGNWILHHDNAPAHNAPGTCEFFLLKQEQLLLHIHHIHSTWPRVTSSYFPKSKEA